VVLERTTLLLRNVDSVAPEFVPNIVAVCDGDRPFPLMLATAAAINGVPCQVRERFLTYLGLNAQGQMAFAIANAQLVAVEAGSIKPPQAG
jgi:hypothetical protein